MTEQSQKRPITVTHIISGDLWAGAEVQVYNLCKALNGSDEVAVTAVVFNRGILHDKLVDLGIPVTLADENSEGPLGIARLIAGHCRSQSTDIVHTHGFKENVLGILGKELARVRYSVRTVHGNPETAFSVRKPHKWAISQLDIWLGRLRQQAVIAVSSQLETSLQKVFPGKVRKIYNFIDLSELQQITQPQKNKRSTQITLGLVGRLVPVKRADIFIRVIHLLNDRGYQCKGVIIGSGPLEEDLKLLAKSLGSSELVEFQGFVNPAVGEIAKLDALVMPSDHEGLPMTLLETAGLAIPVIAHNVGGIPEVIGGWKYGIMVEQHNPEGYTNAIIAALGEITNRRNNVTSQANEHPPGFTERFTNDAGARLYRDLYEEIAWPPA